MDFNSEAYRKIVNNDDDAVGLMGEEGKGSNTRGSAGFSRIFRFFDLHFTRLIGTIVYGISR